MLAIKCNAIEIVRLFLKQNNPLRFIYQDYQKYNALNIVKHFNSYECLNWNTNDSRLGRNDRKMWLSKKKDKTRT